jgi:Xaa-Pro aminopeptidase
MRGFNQEMPSVFVMAGKSGSFPSYGDVPLSGYGPTHAIGQGASRRKVQRNEPVVVDYGAGFNGYITDETRVCVVGELDGRFTQAYEVALAVLDTFRAHARVGNNVRDLYDRCLDVVRRNGLADHFMGYGERQVRFIGHGIGLEINEFPVIARGRDEILEEGMVFAFEPKFVFPGEGAIGVEVDYIVTADGVVRNTDFPVDIIYV